MRPTGDIIRDIVVGIMVVAIFGAEFATIYTIAHHACDRPQPASMMIFTPRLEF